MSDQSKISLPLGDPAVSEVIMGQSPPSSSYNDTCQGLPFFQGKTDFGQLYPTPRKWCSAPSKLARKGDILISVRAPVGDVNLANSDCCIGRGLAAIRPSPSIDSNYLFFCLQTLKGILKSRASGSIFEAINGPTLRELEVPLPPLAEQRAISAILWKLQEAIGVETDLIRVSRELKAAVMNRLFTKGLNGETQKDTEIGLVPESWEVVPLGEEFDTQLGKMLSQKAKTGSNPNLYLRNKNVQWGRIETSDLLRMDFNEREKLKFELLPGDLLVCEGGEPGRAAIWHGEIQDCYYQKALHRLRTKGNISNKFLGCWLEYSIAVANLYRIAGASSTIAHLPEIQLKLLNIPKPPPKEQEEVCSTIESISSMIDTHDQRLKLLTELFAALLSSLMSAEIRVTDLDLKLESPSIQSQGAAAA